MKKKRIAAKYFPVQLPVNSTLIAWLVLDRIHAVGWAWGVMGTILVVLWIGIITELFQCEAVHPKDL